MQAQADAEAAAKAMAGAVARCTAAKAETHTWKLRLEGTLGTLGSAAEAVTRLTAATLQAADVLTCQDPEVRLLGKGHRSSQAAACARHLKCICMWEQLCLSLLARNWMPSQTSGHAQC